MNFFIVTGGAFFGGDASDFPGDDLVHYGNVIYVVANYRLGALGFMIHEVFATLLGNDSATAAHILAPP
jgi:carboxylesterase type B